jgi:pimeloyl-ACP methyl ester carboxylesterase
MTTHLINTPKGAIEYTSIGTGIPLLFVHGGHSNCKETLFHKGFDPTIFQLITPSRPGYGQTPLVPNYSPRDTADLFIALLDVLKIDSVIVIGISAGGLTALELAANYPNRINKLLLLSAVTHKWLTEQDALYKKGKMIFKPSIEQYSWALFRLFYTLFPSLMAKTMFKELSTKTPFLLNSEEIKELRSMINKQRSFTGFVNDLDQNIEQSVISKITCPTLILHSLNDNSVNISHAHHAQQGIKNAVLKTFDNKWGHLLWLGEDCLDPIHEALKFVNHHH